MHFRRAFADPAHPGLAIPALEWKLLRHTVAAVDLHGRIDHPSEHLARVELGDRGLHARVLAPVRLPRALPDQPARRAQLHLGVGEHPLDRLALTQRDTEGRALLGVSDGHAMRGNGHTEIARGVRETLLDEQVEGEIEPLTFMADQVLGRNLAILERHVVRNRRGADRANVPRGEPGRALVDDEAGDAGPPLRLVRAREDDAPSAVVRIGDEYLAAIQHPAIAPSLRARLDGARWIRAAGGLGDGEEGPPALAHGRHRVLVDLFLAAGPDGRRRVTAEDPTARTVEAHPMLGHLLEHDTHAERVEAAAAVLLRRAQRPESGRLRLARETLEVLVGYAGRVGIKPLLERNDLLADEPSNLLAEPAQLVRHRESGKQRHRRLLGQRSQDYGRAFRLTRPTEGSGNVIDAMSANGHEGHPLVAVVRGLE